jgi:cell wall-associated NlpC family hydrolase
MSLLATRDHNLFGMKWSSSFALCPEVSGKASWLTHEEYSGSVVTITSYFTVFKSDADCIKFRSRVFLANSRYSSNSLIQEAISEHSSDKMAEGLKEAGWATSSSYVESLKSVMDTYNLRRFDTMTVEDLANAGLSGDAIVAAAQSQLGVPYVWGGTTPGVGLDCSGLTQYCYKQAGISIPRNSEDQYASGTKKPVSQAQIGDILWRPGHVAIYIGDDKYIHAPYTGEVVKVSSGISYFSAAVSYR